MDAQLIIDEPASGAWNMAVDETLLRRAGETGAAALRFYQWSPPTLSLGYFQQYRDRDSHTASASIAVVRRTTGGGAIVHDREVTYSFVTPITDRFSGAVGDFVTQFHESLIAALQAQAISARLCGAAAKRETGQAFLCFQRREDPDVLIGEHKIAGSAQRRHKGALLQHGSVLLKASNHAPELRGINDLSVSPISVRELITGWTSNLAAALALQFTESSLTQRQRAAAIEVQHERFGCEDWTAKR